jgi:prophage regulatory protein
MEVLATERSLRILRLPAVRAKTGQASSTIYAAMASGNFPRPIPLGERSVGWIEAEIDGWIEACLRKRDRVSP